MSDINKVIIIGRLTDDPALKYTTSGSPVCNISVANNYTWKSDNEKKEKVSFFNCTAWGKIGEIIAQYCKKGQRICIDGRLQQDTWDDPDGRKRSTIKIIVENFQFLSNKSEQSASEPSATVEAVNNIFSDEDIPF